MIYIYDIILNLNKELIEFFEWEEKDEITYVRKIPMYKTTTKFIKDVINNEIKITNQFLENIKNKALLNNKDNISNLCLFTDEKIVLGVAFNEKGESILLSRLIIDEEDEILEFTSSQEEIIIDYEIKSKRRKINNNLTRKENRIKEKIEEELNYLYNNNKVDKLNYFYYEYFNKISNNKDYVYKELITSMNNDFNEKHLKIYEIIKLSYSHK